MPYNEPAMSPEELLKKCVNKDKNAWDEFIRRYSGLVTRSVKYKLNKLNVKVDRSEFQDIVQEIFLSIWEKDKLAEIKNTSNLKGWLVITSINRTSNYCRDHVYKRAKNTLSLDSGPSADIPGLKLGDVIPSPGLNTAKMLEAAEIERLLKEAINKLEYRQRLALKFNLYDGKKQKEIARIMHIPQGTVGYLIMNAKKNIRKKLKEFL